MCALPYRGAHETLALGICPPELCPLDAIWAVADQVDHSAEHVSVPHRFWDNGGFMRTIWTKSTSV
jgi:hypothetical protein